MRLAVASDRLESPVDVGDETRFDYGGFRLNHYADANPCDIGLMICERDRFAGLRPNGSDPGFVMARPFVADGRKLSINATVDGSAVKTGRIAAELRTDGNKAISGFTFADCVPVTESSFAAPISWKSGGLDRAPKELVRIVLQLEGAELYAFELKPSE